MADGVDELCFVAKKAVGGAAAAVSEFTVAKSALVSDLAAKIAEQEGCEAGLVTLICKGKPMSAQSAELLPLVESEIKDGKVMVVYLVRKPAAKAASPAAAAPAATASSAATAPTAPVAATAPTAPAAEPAKVAAGKPGKRVILLLRHGQCCHQGEADYLKELTAHGHEQAEASAKYIAALFEAGKLPAQRALLHSTSKRASQTAAKLPHHLPGIEVWNADLLRETDPTANPFRAEECFNRLFAAPSEGGEDTLIVVAHNNINLYLLMRAAGVPIERAAQAWNLFHLRHASITRIDVESTGARQVVSVGAAGHISDTSMTWNNIDGADMAAWKGGGPERRKFSGRMLVLVRPAAGTSEMVCARQIDSASTHIKGFSGYMMSSHITVACTPSSQATGVAIARKFKVGPMVLPDSIVDDPEVAFLQFFNSPGERGRDTVVLIAEDNVVLYWLLRSLHMSTEEAKAATVLYRIAPASVTLVNAKNDGSMKVVGVGDSGHLPLDCL